MNTLATLVKTECRRQGVPLKELAHRLNTSVNNLTNKFHRNNLTESDARAMAEAIGCTLIIGLEKTAD